MNKFLGASLLLIGLAMVDVTPAQARAHQPMAEDLSVVVVSDGFQKDALHIDIVRQYQHDDLITIIPDLHPEVSVPEPESSPVKATFTEARPVAADLPASRCHGPPRSPN